MDNGHDALLGAILDKAVDRLLVWEFSDTHPLKRCAGEVQKHVQNASALARQCRYEEAVNELMLASEKDPKYIGTRVRAMKYLIRDERPLLGLLIGGAVLVLEEEEEARGQIWDMASGVAFDMYKSNKNRKYLREALAFAGKATQLVADDALFHWNRVEVLIWYYQEMTQDGEEEEARKHAELARTGIREILRIGRGGHDIASKYWSRITDQAERVLPQGEVWENALAEMREIGEKIEDEGDSGDNQSGERSTKPSTPGLKGCFLAATLAVLVWTQAFDMIGVSAADGTIPWEATPQGELWDAEGEGQKGGQAMSVGGDVGRDLAPYDVSENALGKDDENARVDRDDEDLAITVATASVLDRYYEIVRIDREDVDLV